MSYFGKYNGIIFGRWFGFVQIDDIIIGAIKTFNGIVWIVKPVKIYDGTTFKQSTTKYWNGVDWITTPY